ncbi:serine hydrolase domain-containing protein [Maricaulis parjimensis]|uniref:serine hydrolase domain-containing protein n=1 Tax=Maricaulis parjimensis TaxID=144023 RepID=UPI001EEDD634|nr:serine hydrolase [Maricaulis parjimensis]
MKKIIMGLVALAVAVGLAGAGWFYRPWSEYSPAEIQAATQPDRLPETFRNMADVFPYREIHPAESAQPLPRRIAPATVSYSFDGTTRPVDDWLAESRSTGLMVLHNGEVVYENYLLGSTPDTRHTSWSVGKSFVATLIAMAMEDGRIANLDQTAEMFAPQYAGSDFGATTLRHLLMMSAGMDFEEDYDAPDSDIRRLFLGANIYGQNIDTLVADIERNRPAGEDLHYVSANTQVLSAVVRGVWNAPLATVMEQEIWQPLGMTGDAYWNQNIPGENGMAIGYCCLNATLEDYARFGQFYLQDGVWNGTRLLPEGWVQSATRPNADFQEPGPDGVYDHRGYGLHFWVPEGYDQEYFMAGVYGQYVWVDERRNIVIARTAADTQWGERLAESIAAMRALSAHFGDPIETPAPQDNAEAQGGENE